VDLYLDQQSLDTTTPMGKLLFQVTGAFGEFERTMIRQRVNAGHQARDGGRCPRKTAVAQIRISGGNGEHACAGSYTSPGASAQ